MFAHLSYNKLATYWLKNGIFALILSAIYLILIAFLLTPLGSNLFATTEILRSALVIHTNLSILVWFVSSIAAVWSYKLQLSYFTITCVILAFISTALIALSLICGQNFSVMNKYIPVLENILFILGLSLFGVTILLFAFYTLYHTIIYFNDWGSGAQLIKYTIFSTVILFLLSCLCFTISYLQLQEVIRLTEISIEFYYELLFWSGGHLLQFLYTQILILVWVTLFYNGTGRELKYDKYYLVLLALNFVIAAVALGGHLLYNILDYGFKEYYVRVVKYETIITPVLALLLMLYDFIIPFPKTNHHLALLPDLRPSRILGEFVSSRESAKTYLQNNKIKKYIAQFTFICSGILFVLGKVSELLITGTNASTIAYYQAPVIGITVALLGFSFVIIGLPPQST